MRVKRLSFGVACLVCAFPAAFVCAAYLSFANHITPQRCESEGTPALLIVTENNKRILSKEKYVKASFKIEWEGGSAQGDCKIRGRGNTTWVTRELFKRPYLLKLNEAAPLLGFPQASKWVLMANTADKTSLRNAYASYLATEIWGSAAWTPRYRFIALFINGKYNGLYALTEKIEAGEGRVEIDTEAGSFLLEVRSQKNKAWDFVSERGVEFSIREPEDKTESEYLDMQAFIQSVEDALFQDDFADKENGWRRFLDEKTFVDWYLVNEFTKNHDARFQASCYMYYDAEREKIFMGPVWDFDLSCGNISWHEVDDPEGFWVSLTYWYKRLFEDDSFAENVKSRWNERKDELAKSTDIINSMSEEIFSAMLTNDSVWRNIGNRQWPHAPGWRKRKTYRAEIKYMTDFLEKRFEWMDRALNNLNEPDEKSCEDADVGSKQTTK